jgi:hypothetical protein
MAKNRSARAHARKSATVAVNSDQAEQALIDARREQMLAEAEATIDAEAVENNPDVVDSTENYTSIPDGEVADKIIETATDTEPVVEFVSEPVVDLPGIESATEQAQEPAPEPAAPVTDVTDGGRLLASRFPDANEALAYAGNMKLRNYSISRQDDGQYAIEVRKQASAKPAAQTTEGAVQAPARAAPKARTPRAKASGPRPDTRNAVIWSMLTRPEGTTKKEVDAALAAFQPNNIQPCGIGSDAKLFSGRFGYDWKKTSDADGATRYFCFPFAAPEVESESEQEPVVASETESAAS